MSRTYRNIPNKKKGCGGFYRQPKTHSHRKQLEGILTDDELFDYPVSKLNRIEGTYLPSNYDDIPVSAWDEIDYGD